MACFVAHKNKEHTIGNIPLFKCDYPGCDKAYHLNYTLTNHKKRVHLGIKAVTYKKDWICELCGKTLKNSYVFKVKTAK